jgi:hypothetical protein
VELGGFRGEMAGGFGGGGEKFEEEGKSGECKEFIF